MALGFEILVEHLSKQRLGLLQFVLLVLHANTGGAIVFEDLAPGVEQIHDSVLNAAQSFFPLSFVRKRLLAYTFEKTIEKPALELRSNVRNPLYSLRRGKLRSA